MKLTIFLGMLITNFFTLSSFSQAQTDQSFYKAGECAEIQYVDPEYGDKAELKLDLYLDNDGLTRPTRGSVVMILNDELIVLTGKLDYQSGTFTFRSGTKDFKLRLNFGNKNSIKLERFGNFDGNSRLREWKTIIEDKAQCSVRIDQTESMGSHN